MKKMGRKDATNAILANLRSKIFKIFWGSMRQKIFLAASAAQNILSKFLPENQPDHLETLALALLASGPNGLKKCNFFQKDRGLSKFEI